MATITALRGACVTFAEGIAGVKHGSRPVAVAQERLRIIEESAVEWFEAIAQLIGTAIEDRTRTIAAAPAVLAAIGAVGHELANITDTALRASRRNSLLNVLRGVNWNRGAHWANIAGKFTPKGELSAGGPKEVAHLIYTALTDVSSSSYEAVRARAG